MIDIAEFLQWDRLITQSIIKFFYYVAVALAVLFGLSGVVAALSMVGSGFIITGFLSLLASLAMMALGVLVARIACELILVLFRMNDNLEAIRAKGGM